MIKKILNVDCMDYMKTMEKNSVDLTITDIPYDVVNKQDMKTGQKNRIRNLNKGRADIITFDLEEFLEEIFRVTKGSFYIFCGLEQISTITKFFVNKKLSVREIIWEKTNPTPLNAQWMWVSGIERAIYARKAGGTYNGGYANTVLKYPKGRNKYHPTEKNMDLWRHLIEKSSHDFEIVFDPCAGSGVTAVVCEQLNRQYIVCEIEKEYYDIIIKRVKGSTTEGFYF